MKIALAQINPTVGALAANHDSIVAFARRAQAAGASLVIFPEMAICGYPPRDLVEKPEFVAESMEWLRRASRAVPGVTLLCGCVTPAAASTGKRVHNSALALENGEVVFQQSKMLLPTYDVFDELRNFAPADAQRPWRHRGLRIAVTICEDAWNDKNYWTRQPGDALSASGRPSPGIEARPQPGQREGGASTGWPSHPQRHFRLLYERDPVEEQLRGGADLLINISASPYSSGKIGVRQEMLSAIAREYRVPVVLVNQVGGNDQLIFDGTSMALGDDGTLRARAQSFAEDLLVVEAGEWRAEVRPAPEDETAAIWQALVLGTRDYVRKCGFERVLVGLSGGVDSALTAAIAVEALGADNVSAAFLPSRYSSPQSAADAADLARRLGIGLRTLSIEPLFETALATLQATAQQLAEGGAGAPAGDEPGPRPALQQSGTRGAAALGPAPIDDLARQNVQSRLRGMLLMALSNLSGALVLATGNKSELAMGYCTLYGDMIGGLGVIADVLKTEVYALARYANRLHGWIPEAIVARAPTAELKPGQLDADDLPPYAELDQVIRAYVEEYQEPAAIAAALGRDPEWVRALIQRLDYSEYKRQQAPPGLKVSKKAFGMGRRLPIAQRYAPPAVPGGSLPAEWMAAITELV